MIIILLSRLSYLLHLRNLHLPNILEELSICRSTLTFVDVKTENLVEATVVHYVTANVHSCFLYAGYSVLLIDGIL